MKTKNEHVSEHKTFPADKPIPVAAVKHRTPGQRSVIKQTHARRSRRYLRQLLEKSEYQT